MVKIRTTHTPTPSTDQQAAPAKGRAAQEVAAAQAAPAAADQVAPDAGAPHGEAKRLDRIVIEGAFVIGETEYGTDAQGAFDVLSRGHGTNAEPSALDNAQIQSTAARWQRELPELGEQAEALVRDLTLILSATAA